MVLPDNELARWGANGGIRPFTVEHLNPASIDLTWSGRVREAKPDHVIIGLNELREMTKAQREEKINAMFLPERDVESFVFCPGKFYLISTTETVRIPRNAVGLLAVKSTPGRLGLEQLHAGLFDPGFYGTCVLEVFIAAPWAIRINRGDRLIQMYLIETKGDPDRDYVQAGGHYAGQEGAEPAR